jgi:REP-associated tyrosine transposase
MGGQSREAGEASRDPPPERHRKRCRRFNDIGHAHALTFSCFQRQPFLSRERSRLWTLEAIRHARQVHAFHLWAYVLMPEHVHLLIHPVSPEYRISAILSSLKQPVAKKAVRYIREHAPEFLDRMRDRQPGGTENFRFWQRGGGYDRNLWEPRYIWSTIDYIHLNPVRRGLCQRPDDWIWSSARNYCDGVGSAESLDIDFASLPEDPRPG